MMGIRLHIGTGYGILLSKKQVKALDTEHVDAVMDKYFKEHIDHAHDVIMKKNKPDQKIDEALNDEISDALQYHEYIDFEKSKQKGKLVIKHGSVHACVREEFIYPAEEYGTESFIGFINDVHYNSDTCCAMLHPLGMLGVKCDIGEAFEFLIPINDEKKTPSVDNTDGKFPIDGSKLGGKGNEHPKFVPNAEYLFMSSMGKDYIKLVEEANAAGKPIPFQTKDECDEFVTTWLKEWGGISSGYYRRGLQLVQIFYPEVKMKGIERYLVGWWS